MSPHAISAATLRSSNLALRRPLRRAKKSTSLRSTSQMAVMCPEASGHKSRDHVAAWYVTHVAGFATFVLSNVVFDKTSRALAHELATQVAVPEPLVTRVGKDSCNKRANTLQATGEGNHPTQPGALRAGRYQRTAAVHCRLAQLLRDKSHLYRSDGTR